MIYYYTLSNFHWRNMKLPSFPSIRIYLMILSLGCYLLTILLMIFQSADQNFYKFFFLAGSIFLFFYFISYVFQYAPQEKNNQNTNEANWFGLSFSCLSHLESLGVEQCFRHIHIS